MYKKTIIYCPVISFTITRNCLFPWRIRRDVSSI